MEFITTVKNIIFPNKEIFNAIGINLLNMSKALKSFVTSYFLFLAIFRLIILSIELGIEERKINRNSSLQRMLKIFNLIKHLPAMLIRLYPIIYSTLMFFYDIITSTMFVISYLLFIELPRRGRNTLIFVQECYLLLKIVLYRISLLFSRSMRPIKEKKGPIIKKVSRRNPPIRRRGPNGKIEKKETTFTKKRKQGVIQRVWRGISAIVTRIIFFIRNILIGIRWTINFFYRYTIGLIVRIVFFMYREIRYALYPWWEWWTDVWFYWSNRIYRFFFGRSRPNRRRGLV